MSLKPRLHDELNRLAALGTPGGVPPALAIDVSGGHLECQFVAIEQLACSFEQLTYRSTTLDQATMEQLNRIASTLSKKLSYLLEPISPIETDDEGYIVQMRSNPPQKGDSGTSYYELVVRRAEISLCRFAKPPGQPRQVIPASVTREVFHRLAEDLSSAV